MRPQTPPHVRARRAERKTQLLALGFASYGEYLRSPHWRALRVRYRESDLPQACFCGESEVQLHHMTYERLGYEALTDLTTLCGPCHAMVHVLEFRGDIGLDLDGLLDAGRAIEGRELLHGLVEARRAELAAALRAEQDLVLSLPFASRLVRATRRARSKGRDVVSHVRLLKAHAKEGRNDATMTRRLRRIEEIAYAWEGWGDSP